MRDQFGTERGNVKFECEVSSDPRAEIQWFRGTKEIFETPRFTILDKGTTQALLVNNLHLDDQDEYTCKATNSMGSRTTRAQLKLSGKPDCFVFLHASPARPRLFVPPRYHMGVEGDKGTGIELSIPYKAYPSITASWTKDGEKIESGGKYSMSVDERAVNLRINNAERTDTGEYSCTIHNPAGSDSGVVKVTVADRPEPPRFPLIENILDEAIILSWKPPVRKCLSILMYSKCSVDGGSLITRFVKLLVSPSFNCAFRYIVEKSEGGGSWSQCAHSRFTYMTLEGLKANNSYSFRVSAENKYGTSDPCEPTSPVEIPASRVKRKGYDGKLSRLQPGLTVVKQTILVDDVGRQIRGRGSAQANYDTYGRFSCMIKLFGWIAFARFHSPQHLN